VAWGGRPPCSQNARDETALARVKSASWRARDGRVKAMLAVETHPAQAGESVTGRGQEELWLVLPEWIYQETSGRTLA
jgi:hypothetical protein